MNNMMGGGGAHVKTISFLKTGGRTETAQEMREKGSGPVKEMVLYGQAFKKQSKSP